MTTDDDRTGRSAHGSKPIEGNLLDQRLIDYLMALSEALWIPPATTGPAELVYYQLLLADRLRVVAGSLKVVVDNGLSRALPAQTVSLRARVAELPTTTYQYASENWSPTPVRSRPQATGEQIQALASNFLGALLELLDVPVSGDTPPHPWLLEDHAVAADMAMTIIFSDDLSRSLSEGAAHLRDQHAELQKGRY